MMSMKIGIRPAQINGKDIRVGDDVEIVVEPEWNNSARVVVTVPGGSRYTISRQELQAALQACALAV